MARSPVRDKPPKPPKRTVSPSLPVPTAAASTRTVAKSPQPDHDEWVYDKDQTAPRPPAAQQKKLRRKYKLGRSWYPLPYRAHLRYDPPKPTIKSTVQFVKVPQYFPMPQDKNLRLQLVQYNRLNNSLIRDNARLKEETYRHKQILDIAYQNDMEYYALKSQMAILSSSIVELLESVKSVPSIKVPVPLLDFIPTIEADPSQTATGLTAKPLGLGLRWGAIEKGASLAKTSLSPITEESMARPNAHIVRAVSQIAQAAKGGNKRASGKRHTALPGELLAAIEEANLPSSNSSPRRSAPVINSTWKPASTSTEKVNERSDASLVSNDPYNFLAHVNSLPMGQKRSRTAADLDSPKATTSSRRVDVRSPRPTGASRRSLQYRTMENNDNPVMDEPAPSPLKKAFFTPDVAAVHDDLDEEGDIFEPNWEQVLDFQVLHEDDEEEISVEDLIVPVGQLDLSDHSRASSVVEEDANRRPSRAAKQKITSLKEPSLNTKMRRPASIPPVTPAQDRGRNKGGGRGKKGSGGKTTVKIEPISG